MGLELTSVLLGVMSVLLSIITGILLAAIPWGYKIGSRMTKIETKIDGALGLQSELSELRERVMKLETEDRLKWQSKK